jgi:hypothetical protein
MADCGLSFANHNSTVIRSKRRNLFELAAVYAMVLLGLWTPQPWQILCWASAVAMMTIFCISFDGLKPMGLSTANLSGSMWPVGAAMAVAALTVLMAERLHTLHLPCTGAEMIRLSFGYAAWACLQQLVLQCFFLSRLLRLLPDGTMAAGLAAALFAVAHLPSPIMTLITLLCGMAACLFFIHYRIVYPLAVAHAIIGMAIAISVPGPVIHNMRVGLSYLTYTKNPAVLVHLSSYNLDSPLNYPASLRQP